MTIRWGLGPAFYYEWLITSRRWQTYASRCIFVGVLLAGLTIVWASKVYGQSITDMRALASVGESFFYAIAGIQLSLVLLAAPAYTAGAICVDKSRGVLAHLMVTDLSDTEIVLGKLAARLLFVLALLFVTLPVLALATLLGGIAPEALLSSFLVTLGAAVLGCTLALTLSVFGQKTHEVLLATYLAEIVGLLALPVWYFFWRTPPGWLQRANPYWLAFAPYTHPQTTDLGDYLAFLGGCLALSVALVLVANWAIRPLATGRSLNAMMYVFLGVVLILLPFVMILLAGVDSLLLPVVVLGLPIVLAGVFLLTGVGSSEEARTSEAATRHSRHTDADPLRLLVRTALAGLQPSLERNPALWCEWRCRRSRGWMRVIGWLFAGVAGFFAVLALGEAFKVWHIDRELPALVNAFVVSLGMLLLSVSSVTVMAEDRSRGTLEMLLTTPLPSSTIVWAKWWGSFRRLPLLLVLPAVIALAVANRTGRFGMVLVLLLLVMSYAAAVTSLGLALGTWIKRPGRAIALSVSACVLVTIGWVFTLFTVLPDRGGEIGPGLALASPFWGPGLLTVEMDDLSSSFRMNLGLWALLWIVVYLIAANLLLLATILTFDRCLGRVNQNGRVK